MKKFICVYPYSSEMDPMLNHIELLMPDYDVVDLVAPKGWGFEGKEFKISTENKSCNITVKSSLTQIAPETNTIFIPQKKLSDEIQKLVLNRIAEISTNIDYIICCSALSEKNTLFLDDMCLNANIQLLALNGSKSKNETEIRSTDQNTALSETVDVPIIAVAGFLEDTDKFEVSLALRDQFLKQGYRVSQIGSRNYCEMVGFHSFPQFMFDAKFTEEEKVLTLRNFISVMAEDEKPDVIIVTVPGAMQALNDKIPLGFGILAYEVFCALTVDYLVVCTFYDTNISKLLEKISEACSYKFGCKVDCYHMSNLLLDYSEINEQEKLVVEFINRKLVDEYIEKNEFPIPLMNSWNKKHAAKLYNLIIEKLTNSSIAIVQ